MTLPSSFLVFFNVAFRCSVKNYHDLLKYVTSNYGGCATLAERKQISII
jgi:hypothetical protein